MADRSPDFRQRAANVFADNARTYAGEMKALLAKQSASGLLRSGSTIRGAIRIFEDRGAVAIDQLTAEIASVIESRGKAWRTALVDLSEEFTAFTGVIRTELDRVFRAAAASQGAAREGGEREFNQATERLRARIVAFDEGWTAPRAKPWNERRPVSYAIALLIAGAIVGELIKQVFQMIGL